MTLESLNANPSEATTIQLRPLASQKATTAPLRPTTRLEPPQTTLTHAAGTQSPSQLGPSTSVLSELRPRLANDGRPKMPNPHPP
ncbi:hypothetical protein L484_007914 [Morus notabilis]|uniref:Uncharacterized protein n=1 Tax=Morus notabilis TaxID=981085 RepID=W9QSM4_9ROSA|nr:hypothetical protein L484_007914 [Morus notabilis]